MVIMASGIARGRVRTTTTESRNMAAILQITGWQRDIEPWFTVYFFGIEHPCNDQLTPVKTRYPLTSITWPYLGLKFKAHRGQVFFFEVDCWPGAGFLIGSRAHVWLTCWKQGRIVRKPVNAHPGSNVDWMITFSSMQMFLLLFLCIWWLLTENRRPNNIQKTSTQSYKTQIKILLFPGLA